MTVKSLNHKELTKMSPESMRKKRALDAGTLHFARLRRGRIKDEREGGYQPLRGKKMG